MNSKKNNEFKNISINSLDGIKINFKSELFGDRQKEDEIKKKSDKLVDEVYNAGNEVTRNFLKERTKEQQIKEGISNKFISIIKWQIIGINIIMMLIGIGVFKFDTALISIFITGVFGNLITLAVILFNNIFPKDNTKIQADLVKSILGIKNVEDEEDEEEHPANAS